GRPLRSRPRASARRRRCSTLGNCFFITTHRLTSTAMAITRYCSASESATSAGSQQYGQLVGHQRGQVGQREQVHRADGHLLP
ncbi:hypothetical protein BRO20_07310, partial [Xanthomonas oryzae pv. oryzae]